MVAKNGRFKEKISIFKRMGYEMIKRYITIRFLVIALLVLSTFLIVGCNRTTTLSTSKTTETTSNTTTQTTTQNTTASSNQMTTSEELTVLLISDGFQIDKMNEVIYEVDLNNHPFYQLLYLNQVLSMGEDYVYDGLTSKITLLPDFLIKIYQLGISNYSFSIKTQDQIEFGFQVEFDHPENRILNAGFETGDFYGWTPYALWKDEASMSSFRNSRVVNTDYYGSSHDNLYNQDGNYLFGLYVDPYDNQNKDLNQERMGMLRSMNFTLGGSGYISFKLGGGKNQGTAYISVHDASNDEELARFGNSNFNDTSISETNNAEGYLFQYYADLSQYIGKELYLLAVDQAANEWSVLAFDSFYTYYENTPSYGTSEEAINILPEITDVGLNHNYISNGDLTDTLIGWGNPQDVFQIDSSRAISSNGGNDALGVLRSPAFSLDGENKYLSFEFAGAISKDKQIYLSVKEVSTNLEVLRLTRRSDLSNYPNSGDLHHHYYDLSGLDPNKEYYLELVDNEVGDWGVAILKNVSLESENTWQANQVAVNAFYGLAQVSPIDGSHHVYVSKLDSARLDTISQVVLTLGEVATNSMRISYHSQNPYTTLEYTTSDDTSFLSSTSIDLFGELYGAGIESNLFGIQENYIYQTEMSNLLPGTQYLYRIHEGYLTSEVYTFHTASDDNTFRFLFLTDTQSNDFQDASITKTLLEQANTHYDDFEFLMNTGDIVENGSSHYYWSMFFQTRMTDLPIMSAIGNHDYLNSSGQITSPDNYNTIFNNPKNGSESYQNTSYFVEYDNVLFIMLDVITGENLSEQQLWFRDVIDNHSSDYVIVGMHYSPYGTYHESSAAEIITDWIPIFDETNVDLVLSGHDHIYARTLPMINSSPVTNPNVGTTYFIGGTGSHKFRQVEQGEGGLFEFYLEDTFSSISMISVNDSQILIQSIDINGNVFDEFSIPIKNK